MNDSFKITHQFILAFTIAFLGLTNTNLVQAQVEHECIEYRPSPFFALDSTYVMSNAIVQTGRLAGCVWRFPYISIVPFGDAAPMYLDTIEAFNDWVEEYYDNIYYHYYFHDICENSAGEILILMEGSYEDIISPFDNRLVLRVSQTGEILGSETYLSTEQNVPVAFDFPCAEFQSDVSIADLPGHGNALFQKQDNIIETSYVSIGRADFIYYERYESQNPPSTEVTDIGLTNIEIESYTHYSEEDTYYYYGDCHSTMSNISVEVTNFGNTAVCYYLINFERELFSFNCPSYSTRTMEIDSCLLPNQSVILTLEEDWWVAALSCANELDVHVINPNNCTESDYTNNELSIEATLDEGFCSQFNAFVGEECSDSNGNTSIVLEDCSCDENLNCEDLIEITATITCNAANDSIDVSWTFGGGLPEMNSESFYVLNGTDISNQQVLFGASFTSSYPIDESVSLTVSDETSCLSDWVLNDEIECVGVGVDELDQFELSLFPNPTKGNLQIEIPENGEVLLCDFNGKQLMQTQFETGHQNINLSFLSTGLYFLRYTSENFSEVRRVYKR